MKVKEIEVWVRSCNKDSSYFNETNSTMFFSKREAERDRSGDFPEGSPIYKAKLIVEVPEKKIEITESDFDRLCLEDHPIFGFYDPEELISELKYRLGFDDE